MYIIASNESSVKPRSHRARRVVSRPRESTRVHGRQRSDKFDFDATLRDATRSV